MSSKSKPESKPAAKHDLRSLPLSEVEKELASSSDGLSQAEAEKRLAQYGPNEIEEKKTNALLNFLRYFWGPIPWMIEAAVILSAVARHWPDFGIILLLLVCNAMVGFLEERQAGNAIAALKAKLAIKARVKRDGTWITPAASELVPGDVIRFRLGDIVPADARLLAGDPVEVDQSALTGESLPAMRNPGEAVFSGSIIRQGEIAAWFMPPVAHLLRQDRTTGARRAYRQPLSTRGAEDRQLSDHPRGGSGGGDYYRRDLSRRSDSHHVAVRIGADRGRDSRSHADGTVGDDGGRARLLASKEAIVSRLVAIEELAGVDVLCADKTGTLTQNKLTLGDPFSVGDIPTDQVILCAALASRAEDNDVIDMAVIGGLKNEQDLKSYQVVHFQPFDPVHKRTEATVKAADGKQFFVAKGAPQVILEISTNAGEVKPGVEKAINEFAARGFRSLGVARADQEGKWRFLGVLPLSDPPRDDAKLPSRPRADGCRSQDGDGRSTGHRQGNCPDIGAGHSDSRRQRLGRCEA